MAEPLINASYRLPQDVYNALKDEAEERGESMNALVIQLLRKGLKLPAAGN